MFLFALRSVKVINVVIGKIDCVFIRAVNFGCIARDENAVTIKRIAYIKFSRIFDGQRAAFELKNGTATFRFCVFNRNLVIEID